MCVAFFLNIPLRILKEVKFSTSRYSYSATFNSSCGFFRFSAGQRERCVVKYFQITVPWPVEGLLAKLLLISQ